MKSSTIAAIATPLGQGGIGIIKISGPDALAIAGRLFRTGGRQNLIADQTGAIGSLSDCPRQLLHGYILDPEEGSVLDEVLIAYMPAPKTYTREDIVEIYAHAGEAGLTAILELVLAGGARMAGPGEFTKRAFLNGRIDLTQAEAVIDLINARSKAALVSASGQLKGKLGEKISELRRRLKRLQVEVEAGLDFPEAQDEEMETLHLAQEIRREFLPVIQDLLDQHSLFRHVKTGIHIALAGPPNVGKSSLMNRLAMQERSIVTPIPGTTRDLVEETLLMDGISFRIIDTAGLRTTEDMVEKIGVERTVQAIQRADIVLFMVDPETRLSRETQWLDLLRGKTMVLVRNKIDLPGVEEWDRPDHPALQDCPTVQISVVADKGIADLKRIVKEVVQRNFRYPDGEALIPNMRQKEGLASALKELNEAADAIENGLPLEMAAINLNRTSDFLLEITGQSMREDLLDEIFSRFCIGK